MDLRKEDLIDHSTEQLLELKLQTQRRRARESQLCRLVRELDRNEKTTETIYSAVDLDENATGGVGHVANDRPESELQRVDVVEDLLDDKVVMEPNHMASVSDILCVFEKVFCEDCEAIERTSY
jgi:hypothetical protein